MNLCKIEQKNMIGIWTGLTASTTLHIDINVGKRFPNNYVIAVKRL